ncbi:hypothetical protein P8625_11150 [Tenacibaculum tangerinum]|uniref:Uncharacterized protein n=1 Tax=Tenacibaculum tangerinum TaxID=3038772 RepID=A0ABY8L1W0_9FLAO|nr:hypothetical protein [Tenacibaculum tangerinum]WGH74642.1 hypothetical protein P8625_11150 [Tenacibaculum tangerinum]
MKEFAKSLPKHLKDLKKWIREFFAKLEAKALVIDNAAYSFTDPITALGKTFFDIVRKNAWKKLNKLGVNMLKNEEGLYSFTYNGKKIEDNLSIKEAREFLEELLGDVNTYSRESMLEYLDELIEVAKKSRISGFKLKPMLRKYLGEDIGIHPYTGKPSEFSPFKVSYLNKKDLIKYEIKVKNGKLVDYKGELFDSMDVSNITNNGKAIFVMDEVGKIYASKYPWMGEFHHSSFLGGGPVVMAGELAVFNGLLIKITNSTGHYKTKERHLNQFLEVLKKLGVDTKIVDLSEIFK